MCMPGYVLELGNFRSLGLGFELEPQTPGLGLGLVTCWTRTKTRVLPNKTQTRLMTCKTRTQLGLEKTGIMNGSYIQSWIKDYRWDHGHGLITWMIWDHAIFNSIYLWFEAFGSLLFRQHYMRSLIFLATFSFQYRYTTGSSWMQNRTEILFPRLRFNLFIF